MGDILLVQPPIADFYLTAKRTVPYGLAAIAASLRAKGFSVEILDALATDKSRVLPYPPEMAYLKPYYGAPDISPFALFHSYRRYGYSDEHIGRVARASGAFLVGISSLFTPYADAALQTARVIRAALPACRIVLGGHHPTALPEAVMSDAAVDFVLRGEGEEAMPVLAESLRTGADLSRVPGIVFRRADESLHIAAPAVIPALDALPPPARDLIDHRYYRRAKRGATVVVTARGCPLRCSYCALGNPRLYPYRPRDSASVLAEIDEAVCHHDARFIDFEDENIAFNRPVFLSLLTEISSRYAGMGLELRAMNGLFPPSLDAAVVAAMKSAGFSTLNLSLGSACPRQLKRFNRPDVRHTFEEALRLAEIHGMEAVGYIIVGAPGQHPFDSVSDLLYLASRRVLAGVSVYYPAPASADYETCRSQHLLPDRFSLMAASALPISDTTTRLETLTLVRLGRILNFMKQLTDRGIPLLSPDRRAPLDLSGLLDLSDLSDRQTLGIRLLRGFLQDGLIRGITPEGVVYEHAAAADLTAFFLKGLAAQPLRGVRG